MSRLATSPQAAIAALVIAITAVGCTGALAVPSAAPQTAPPTAVSSPTRARRRVSRRPSTPTPTTIDTPEPTPEPTSIPFGGAPIGETERATVVAVVDGDTIKIDRGQGIERVRYIGVDTPETVHPSKPVEFMGKEASAANRALVEGREVLLERDLTEHDRYGRLLRYVWVEDPSSPSGMTFVNAALLAGGFAQVVTYPPDVRYVDLYLAAQREAREQGRGLWADPRPASRGDVSSARTGHRRCLRSRLSHRLHPARAARSRLRRRLLPPL